MRRQRASPNVAMIQRPERQTTIARRLPGTGFAPIGAPSAYGQLSGGGGGKMP